ncbi:MAG: dockerin type I repeat-containing protein [Oscillospiraceae bacterium]|nr:dockerin type I repeat-containing protein [Oscillospiraceae bacterium]
MKKSIQSILTAAMFTAAATSSLNASAAEAQLMQKTAEPENVLYGPPWVFAESGDMNYDFQLDVRDVTHLKQIILEERSPQQSDTYLGDVNGDGSIDKEDVKALIRKLTGKPEDEEEVTEPIVSTITTMQTAYGPPPVWG